MRTRPIYVNPNRRNEMIVKSTKTPFNEVIEFFTNHIRENGNQIHPVLGDLRQFANEVEILWNKSNPNHARGENLVVGFLRNQFPLDQSEEEMAWGEASVPESTFNSMG